MENCDKSLNLWQNTVCSVKKQITKVLKNLTQALLAALVTFWTSGLQPLCQKVLKNWVFKRHCVKKMPKSKAKFLNIWKRKTRIRETTQPPKRFQLIPPLFCLQPTHSSKKKILFTSGICTLSLSALNPRVLECDLKTFKKKNCVEDIL